MAKGVAFVTPGLIPLEAFTTFGVNVKPNSTNPFGFFGTGLKYAISVCLRARQVVVLWRGMNKYTFYVKDEDFRGKTFAFVRMKIETWNHLTLAFWKPKYIKLPFTLELGKNWELWQAFRELETNTRDEAGFTATVNHDEEHRPTADRSIIYVMGGAFVDEYHERFRTFLPEGLTEREGPEGIQVLERPSKHIYYRGVRVLDLKSESMMTYNFLKQIDLTEDRTVKHSFMIESDIANYLMETENEGHLTRALGAPKDSYEGRLNYGYGYREPSERFVAAARVSPNPTAREIHEVHTQPVTPTTKIMLSVPRAEVTDAELDDIVQVVSDLLGIQVEVKNMAEAA